MDVLRTESRAWRAVYAVTLLLLLGVFLYSVQSILNPFVLFLLIALLASPFSGARTHRLLMVAVGILAILWLLATLGSLLAPFFLALGAAYLLYPLVRRLEARGVSRGLAITVLALPALAAVTLAIILGIPALGRQLAELISGVPAALQRWAEWGQRELTRRDFPFVNEAEVLARLQAIQPEAVLEYLQDRRATIARNVWIAVTGAGRGVSFVLTLLGYLFLTPILTFYLLRDWDRLQTSIAELIPGVSRARVVGFFREYDRLLSGYVRGTLLEASIVGMLTFAGLWIFGIPFAFLLGVMAALFNIIPYLGLVLTLIPALIVAVFTASPLLSMGKVAIVFAIVQALDGAIIGPKVLGESVGLHPVLVILALSVAGFFWGFLGLLLAVPLAVLVKLLLRNAVAGYRRSSVFVGENA